LTQPHSAHSVDIFIQYATINKTIKPTILMLNKYIYSSKLFVQNSRPKLIHITQKIHFPPHTENRIDL